MKIKKEKNIYIIENKGIYYYEKTYEKILYWAAYFLVGDRFAYESLDSFHTALKTALNREYQGNLGSKIDFKGKWFYPSVKYCQNIQEKVKYLELT